MYTFKSVRPYQKIYVKELNNLIKELNNLIKTSIDYILFTCIPYSALYLMLNTSNILYWSQYFAYLGYKRNSSLISSVILYILGGILFILLISLILLLKYSNVGLYNEHLWLFNFTMVTFILALLRVKNIGLSLIAILNRLIKVLSFSNW